MSRSALYFLLPTLSLGLLSACGNGAESEVQVRPVMVEQPQATSGEVQIYAGDIRARHQPVLSFRIGGKILQHHVDVGVRVEQNQILAELDPKDLQLQVAAQRAQLAAAETQLATVRSELDRYRAMFERRLISHSLFEQQENAFRHAQAQVKQGRAQLGVSLNQAEYALLRAPAAGVITLRQAEAGQTVAAGQPIYTLAIDGEREVAISLPEHEIQHFSVGQAVLVELWSQQGKRIRGTLRELAPAADPVSRTFAARVSFDPSEAGAELGQSARVYAGQTTAALSIPLSAVTAEAEQAYVWVIDPASAQTLRTPVQLGAYNETRIPVLAGLSPRDWVVVAGVHQLREGQKVRPIDHDNRVVILEPQNK